MLFLRSNYYTLTFIQTPLPVVADHPQQASEAYKKWLSSWQIGEVTYTISENIANKSYIMGDFIRQALLVC